MKIAQIATALAIIIIIAILLLPKSSQRTQLKRKKKKKTSSAGPDKGTADRNERRNGIRAGDYKWTQSHYGDYLYGLQDYWKYGSGSDMSIDRCKKAAQAFGGTYKKTSNWSTLASGCIKRMGYPHFYYNTAKHDVSCGNLKDYACVLWDPAPKGRNNMARV